MQVPAQHLELEEVTQDAEVLVVGAAGAFAPLRLEELFESLCPDRRLQVADLEVGEVAGELVEAGFVIAVRRRGEPLPFRAKVVTGLLPERERAVGLVLHGFTQQPCGCGEG